MVFERLAVKRWLPPHAFDVVVMAASAGGFRAVSQVCAALPPNFPAAIVLVQHMGRWPNRFVDLLKLQTDLSVCWGQEGAELQQGSVVVAPPDHHLLLNAHGRLTLTQTPKVNHVRPSADPLFTSVALEFRERALGVILTGAAEDGALGSVMLKQLGGRVLAQDPATAEYGAMPAAAIATGSVDFVLPLERIALALTKLVMGVDVAGVAARYGSRGPTREPRVLRPRPNQLVDLPQALAAILDAARLQGGLAKGNIQLVDPQTGHLRIVAQRGFDAPFLKFFDEVHSGQAACGAAMQNSTRVIVEDVTRSPIFTGLPLEVLRTAGVRAVQSTPLFSSDGRLLGMFSTHYAAPRRLNARELRFLDQIARQAAHVVMRDALMCVNG